MFDNIGGKIKRIAQIICVVGIVASVVLGIAMLAILSFQIEGFLAGLVIAAVGSASSWLMSAVAYGFGELIEETSRNRAINQQVLKLLETQMKTGADGAPHSFVPSTGSVKQRAETAEWQPHPNMPAAQVVIMPSAGSEGWNCKKCGTRNVRGALTCRDCGAYR